MLRTVIAVLALSVLAALPARAEPMELTIVHVNDWDRMEAKDGLGGAARIATVVKDERARAEAEGGLVLVTYGGDLISPSLLSGLDRGAHMIVLANTLKLDAATLGNHEFDFGTEVLVASVRGPAHVVEAAKIGADVVTLPPAVLRALYAHPLTDKGLAAFLADWAKTGQSILGDGR